MTSPLLLKQVILVFFLLFTSFEKKTRIFEVQISVDFCQIEMNIINY